MSAENKALIRRVEEAWNTNNLSALDPLFAPNFMSHSAIPMLPPGLPGAKQAHQMAMKAFPDRKVSIEDIIAEGDKVVVRARVTATNKGGVPWMGVPANDKKIDTGWVSIYRIANGKVAEHWGINDEAGLMRQLGALPTGARA